MSCSETKNYGRCRKEQSISAWPLGPRCTVRWHHSGQSSRMSARIHADKREEGTSDCRQGQTYVCGGEGSISPYAREPSPQAPASPSAHTELETHHCCLSPSHPTYAQANDTLLQPHCVPCPYSLPACRCFHPTSPFGTHPLICLDFVWVWLFPLPALLTRWLTFY